jgi:hypothetical protein
VYLLKLKYYILAILLFSSLQVWAIDTSETVLSDSTVVQAKEIVLYEAPTTNMQQEFKPDPLKAIWYAAVVPGLGQVYNRKYWKLPILYGGAMGLTYAISWNGGLYRDYQKAYRDILDSDPLTESYLNVLPSGVEITSSNKSYYANLLKNKQDNYLRYRDLSIIGTATLYLLSIVDAFVDAHLYDFDVSPDLSLKLIPKAIPLRQTHSIGDVSFGLSCQFTF